jgi:hypothetical protein
MPEKWRCNQSPMLSRVMEFTFPPARLIAHCFMIV